MTVGPIVKVCLTPALYPLYRCDDCNIVVVDVLRATSAITTAIFHGVKSVIPVTQVEETLPYQNNPQFILAAERGGQKVDGFEYGNSPLDYCDNEFLKEKTLVLTTTNGTQAIEMARHDGQVLVGSFGNLSALKEYLLQDSKDCMILCAGWKGRFNLEDTLFAGALVEELLDAGFGLDTDTDSALASLHLYRQAAKDMQSFLADSSHRNRLFHLDLSDDVTYCLTHDHTPCVPKLTGNELINAI
jgi:2-phosphosulfolactate phosphatase